LAGTVPEGKQKTRLTLLRRVNDIFNYLISFSSRLSAAMKMMMM
jgi:hypothetical protein